MYRRLAAKLAVALSLALVVGAGCSRSGDSKPAPKSGERSIADLWTEMLNQRDQIHVAFVKEPEEVTHADCTSVGSAARRMDELYSELIDMISARATPDEQGKLRALGEIIGRGAGVVSRVRETALIEAPGAWPALRYPLDQSLREVELYLTAADLRDGSVMKRPGFESTPPPTAPSVI